MFSSIYAFQFLSPTPRMFNLPVKPTFNIDKGVSCFNEKYPHTHKLHCKIVHCHSEIPFNCLYNYSASLRESMEFSY